MSVTIRPIDPEADHEVATVAQRMRSTLVEVLGDEEGPSRYSLEWLQQRVLWHLDPSSCRGQVFVAEDSDGELLGHCIVRIEREEDEEFGLFSTTWVQPGARRLGIAGQLLQRGEDWMCREGMQRAVTFTDPENHKLIALYKGRDYQLSTVSDEFVRLDRHLPPA